MGEEFHLFGWHLDEMSAVLMFGFVMITILLTIRVIYAKTIVKEYFPESAMLIVVGFVLGLIMMFIHSDTVKEIQNLLAFPPDLFLYIFIPIILFDQTYFLNKNAFFHNFVEIGMFAFIGTTLNTFITAGLLYATKFIPTKFSGGDYLTYAALISSIDPVAVIAIMESMQVNETLFNMTFGESTLNDGIAIVLFHLFMSLDSLIKADTPTSQIIGLGFAKFLISLFGSILLAGIITCLFSQITRFSHKIPVVEPFLMLCCAFVCYLLCDALLVSAIIGIMISAFILVFYTQYNLQKDSREVFNELIHSLGSTCENLLFLDMGFQIAFYLYDGFDDNGWKIDFVFTFMMIFYFTISRVVTIFAQSAILNIKRSKTMESITWQDCIILIWSGLRGAMAFALAIDQASELDDDIAGKQITFSTAFSVFFTILVQGLTMRPIIKLLKIKTLQAIPNFQAKTLSRPIIFIRRFIDQIVGKSHFMRVLIMKFDKMMQKIFMKKQLSMDRELIEIVQEFQQQFAEELSKRKLDKLKNDESLRRKQMFGDYRKKRQTDRMVYEGLLDGDMGQDVRVVDGAID